jgi:hypothetical protein
MPTIAATASQIVVGLSRQPRSLRVDGGVSCGVVMGESMGSDQVAPSQPVSSLGEGGASRLLGRVGGS